MNVWMKVKRRLGENIKSIVSDFLGDHRSPEYKQVVEDILKNDKALGVLTSIKKCTFFTLTWIIFQRSQLCPWQCTFFTLNWNFFPGSCVELSEEQGDRFHRDIKLIEERYQSRWNINTSPDYSWCLKRDTPEYKYRQKSVRKSFIPAWYSIIVKIC